MDLLNTQESTRNTKILVNGTIYDIGEDCVARNVSEEDAKKLLSFPSRVWRVWDGGSPKPKRKPITSKPVEPEPESEPVEDEYPAPTLQMSKAQLQEIASAYQVDFNDRTSKPELVRLIEAVMFEPID